MHGYDSYDFDHRNFYPAADVFTTVDWKAEDTPDFSVYSYAACNPVRFRDENGDGLGDFLIGLASAVLDDANPVGGNKISEKAPRDNETHFKVGQTVGHVVAAVIGTEEAINGGITGIAGAVTAPETAGVTTPVAIAGGIEAAHGIAMTGKAVLNASRMNFQNGNKGSKNLVKEAKESQAKKEKAQERKENREAATARGNSRSGNSNQGSRGSHDSRKGGNKGDKHSNAEARRLREQKKADEKNK